MTDKGVWFKDLFVSEHVNLKTCWVIHPSRIYERVRPVWSILQKFLLIWGTIQRLKYKLHFVPTNRRWEELQLSFPVTAVKRFLQQNLRWKVSMLKPLKIVKGETFYSLLSLFCFRDKFKLRTFIHFSAF